MFPIIAGCHECTGAQLKLADFSFQVKEKFNNLRRRIQDLEQMGKEQDKESDRYSIKQKDIRNRLLTSSHRSQFSKTAWRKVSLACKLSIDWLEKDDLLNSEDMWIRHRKMSKESLTQTSCGITESLMSISRMMAQQVQQSEETMSTLVGATSSRPVLETHEEFKAMTGTIQLGRKLIIIYNGKMACDVLLLTEQTIKATTHFLLSILKTAVLFNFF
uniref:BCL2 interacting protein 1a n=1 Tax=Cyprinus carpio TaxID=7962 RepID=A0A8C2C498_CYPCA